MTDDVSKDLVFAQPREPVKAYGYEDQSGKTRARDWTVAEVEEAMWRVRASGGTDSTPIVFRQDYGEAQRELGMTIRAKYVEASPIYEVPRRHEPEPAAPAPVPDESQWWYRPAQVLGALLALPCVIWLLAFVWSVTVGSLLR